MSKMRRMLLVATVTAVLLLVSATAALAQTYPPPPGPDTAAGAAARAQEAARLALTGRDHALEYALVGGVTVLLGAGLIVTTRRRHALVRA